MKKPVTRCRYCKKWIWNDTGSFCCHCGADIDRQFADMPLAEVQEFCRYDHSPPHPINLVKPLIAGGQKWAVWLDGEPLIVQNIVEGQCVPSLKILPQADGWLIQIEDPNHDQMDGSDDCPNPISWMDAVEVVFDDREDAVYTEIKVVDFALFVDVTPL